jgi:hypothetical protein
MRLLNAACLVALSSLTLAACGNLEGKPSWIEARVNDLADAVPFSLAGGPGVIAAVRAPFLGTGVGFTRGVNRFGWPGLASSRSRAGDWYESETGGLIGYARESSAEGRDVVYIPLGPFVSVPSTAHSTFDWAAALDVEATVHLGLIGARLGVSPVQLLDFVLGFVGLDLTGDDDIARDPRTAFRRVEEPAKT